LNVDVSDNRSSPLTTAALDDPVQKNGVLSETLNRTHSVVGVDKEEVRNTHSVRILGHELKTGGIPKMTQHFLIIHALAPDIQIVVAEKKSRDHYHLTERIQPPLQKTID
jgi:hypothetical protein